MAFVSARGVLPSCVPHRASEAILGSRRRADNSGLSAQGPPAETHKCTALGLIYLQNRRSTTELRPHAYLCLGSPKQAKMSSRSTAKKPHSACRSSAFLDKALCRLNVSARRALKRENGRCSMAKDSGRRCRRMYGWIRQARQPRRAVSPLTRGVS